MLGFRILFFHLVAVQSKQHFLTMFNLSTGFIVGYSVSALAVKTGQFQHYSK
jgi:hypothetical protein